MHFTIHFWNWFPSDYHLTLHSRQSATLPSLKLLLVGDFHVHRKKTHFRGFFFLIYLSCRDNSEMCHCFPMLRVDLLFLVLQTGFNRTPVPGKAFSEWHGEKLLLCLSHWSKSSFLPVYSNLCYCCSEDIFAHPTGFLAFS